MRPGAPAQAAALALAAVPLVAALAVGGATPGDGKLFGATLIALGSLALALLWAGRHELRAWSQRRVRRVGLGLITTSLVMLVAERWTYDRCVVTFEREDVVFPLWPTGDLAFMLDQAHGPIEAMYMYQPAAVKDEIAQQPSLRRAATTVILVVLYQGIFLPLSIAFGIAGLKGVAALRAARHRILFFASRPTGLDPLALDREARAIHTAIERGIRRRRFRLETRWAVQHVDVPHEVRAVGPAIVHFSGHGAGRARTPIPGARDVEIGSLGAFGDGLYLEDEDGAPRLISTAALARIFGAAGGAVRLVVLNACYSAAQAGALLAHVDAVIGMSDAIPDEVAIRFAAGFYAAIADGASLGAAYAQAQALLGIEGQHENLVRLETRAGVAADELVLEA